MLEVSKSGYYRHCQRPPSKRALDNIKMTEKIKKIHRDSRECYGSPRIHSELKSLGIQCGKHRVARLMRLEGIKAKAHRRQKWNPCVHYEYPKGQDLLKRNFVTTKPNRAWVSDITYISTEEGWVYLVAILDLFSRKIVGYRLSEQMGSDIVIDAFEDAITLRQPPEGLIFHSDRGMQYISDDFQDRLKSHGVLGSMSRKGNCWDNAVAESFFHTLKTELVRHYKYTTREQAKRSIFEYIFNFYNNKRRHSYLNQMSPIEFEKAFMDA